MFENTMKMCAVGLQTAVRRCVALAVAFGCASALFAAEVTSTDAARAAQAWVDRGYAMGVFASERTVSGVDEIEDATTGARLHVVKFEGGGFVVLSADDLVDPVISFSATGNGVPTDDDNPFWTLLRGDIAARESAAGVVRGAGTASRRLAASRARPASATSTAAQRKWSALLGGGTRLLSANGDGVQSLSDMRVAPLVQSQWGQSEVGGEPCFNSFTPYNSPCGCVATAGAQIMRYFQWPAVSMEMPPFTNPHCAVSNAETVVKVNRPLTTQGGSYDWTDMPLDPVSTAMSSVERQAIGKLTSDIGICCGMTYYENSASVGSYMLAETFTNHFGYGSALAAQWNMTTTDQSGATITTDISGTEAFRRALLSNFDAGLPVVLSLRGVRYDHAVVSDGYGYSDGSLFVHLNFGWTGISDAWYSPPNLFTGNDDDYNYTAINGFIFNILPNMSPNTVICSGRVLDADGNPVAGAVVSYYRSNSTSGGGIQSGNDTGYVMTGSTGIYALRLPPGQYVVRASFGAMSATTTVTLSPNVATKTAHPNLYWPDPPAVVNNLIDQNLVLSSLEGVAVPVFDPPSCLFYPTTNVSITCATSGATIRYTLDGTEPTETSTIYTGPIVLSDNAVITAKAWADGMNPSPAISATYTFDVSQGAPRGDYFADPIIISGANGTRVVEDNSAYTVEPGEPLHTLDGGFYYYQYNTIWYEWTAPGTGTMVFSSDLVNQMYGTYIAVYVGDSLSSLNRICYAKWTDGQVPDENDLYMCAPAVATVSVEQGVTYRIVGMVQSSDLHDTFTLTWSGDLVVEPTVTPLEITTSVLHPATVGESYSATLEATGGVAPYIWSASAADGYDETREANSSFSAVGTAQGWKQDDAYWELSLPFAFPFYGTNYQSVWVSSNGTLSFGESRPDRLSGTTPLVTNVMIAVLWKDLNTSSGDIYVENASDHVTIRWEGTYYTPATPVSFSATLYADGTIRLRYGDGNANGGMIGISSGTGERWSIDWIEISQYNDSSLENAQDIVFTPRTLLPSGLSLSSAGVLSGTPETPGVESVAVFVTDAAGTKVGRTFNLTIRQPLEITTSVLHPATVGESYSATLEATGGVSPYTWSAAESDGYDETREANSSFSAVGTAKGWQDDDNSWELPLPFDFPFYGSTYSNVWVSSNGTLTFDGLFTAYTSDSYVLSQHPMIAVLWKDLKTSDGDIYVESSSEVVTIRWSGIYYNSTSVSFSATLYADGTIRLRYGDGNEQGGMIGISSGNYNSPNYILLPASESSTMDNEPDIVFTPQMALPDGLSLSSAGVLSGTPTTAGAEAVTVFVTDGAGTRTGRTFNLTIETAPPPVVSPSVNSVIACESNGAAVDLAALLNGEKKATYLKAPEQAGLVGETATAYANCFNARADGNNVVIELTAAGTNALLTASTNVAAQVAADLPEVAATTDAMEIAVTGARPGFYYSVVYDDDLRTLGASAGGEGPRALANVNGAVVLPIPQKKANATSGFYRIKVSVRATD